MADTPLHNDSSIGDGASTSLPSASPASASESSSDARPHVVIVGGGFAGLEAAKGLIDEPVRVTLIDRNNYHKFQPLLYEVAMAGLEPDDIAHNIRHIFQDAQNVHFRLGTVGSIDADGKTLTLLDGQTMQYDALILAAGAVTNDFGIEGVREHGFPLKNVPDAVNLRNHVLRQFERYDRTSTASNEGDLTFVVVGGGPTGVETAGALVELFDTLNDDFRELDTTASARCVLLEMQDALLPPYDPSLQEYTRDTLEARGVDVMTGAVVQRVEADRVHLGDGRTLPTRTLIWAAGVKASPVADMVGAKQERGGRVIVQGDLSIGEYPDIYAVGDMAAIEGDDGYEPQLAQVAMQSGKHAARQVLRRLQGQDTETFAYRDLGQMATIGRNAAVAELAGGIKFKGLFAWALWVFIHIAKLVGFRNRLSAFVNWTYNYFTYSRSARLILDMVPIDDEISMEIEEIDEEVQERLREVRATAGG